MKQTLPILAIAGILFTSSCKKNDDSNDYQNPKNASDLSELTIPSTFNWSNSFKGRLNVNILADKNFITEGQVVQIIDELDNVLETKKIKSNNVSFYLNLPQTEGSYFLFCPSTRDKMELKGTGKATFKLHINPITEIDEILKNVTPANQRKSAQKKSSTTNLIVNGDFSQDAFYSYPNTPITGKWYKYDNNYTWSSENGSKVWKAKNRKSSYIGQLVDVTPGDSISVSADYYATSYSGGYIMLFFYNSSGNYLSGQWFSLQNGFHTSYVSASIPTNSTQCEVMLYANNKTWFDNVTAETKTAIIDTDNDGVEDNLDEFPNDPTRAYTSSYPTAGTQKLAFEDSWPFQGDYDFNDMVIDCKVDYTLDANSNLVDAQFSIYLNACGAGLSSGLAINLLNSSKNPISSSIISSVSGATIDPDNSNGIVVFNDAFAAQSIYYTNTGTGADATPDKFTFTVTFVSGVSPDILPDYYIFRTDDRGREIHLNGFSGTAAANVQLHNMGKDLNGTYKTSNGLPWAIEITSYDSFQYPLEKVDILLAYPKFQTWAESGGISNLDWFLSPNLSNIF